jgi:3-hydroxyacyl-CoA dehydrogenase
MNFTLKEEVRHSFLCYVSFDRYSILNECYHLIKDGVLSADGVDKLMKFGLGPRYAWMGPLETAVLNAEGVFLSSCELATVYL